MKTNKNLILSLLAIVLILGGAALLAKYSRPKQAKELEPVALKLKWVNQAQFAGNYVAKEKGFYAEEGLKVDLIPFSFKASPIEDVVDQKALLGITGADELIMARAKGMPIEAIAIIYRINPVCAYSLKESGITKPQDFIGKTVGLERGTNVDTLYFAMMAKLGIDRSKIKEITIGYDATELLNKRTDVSTGYIINEPNQVVEAGHKVNTILMADYGVNMAADVLFATEDTINNKPKLVERFLRATLKGWQYAIKNKDEAVTITLKYATDRTRSHEDYMLQNSIPLIHTGRDPIGWMTEADWKNVQDILLAQKLLAKPIDIDKAYTMQFLNKVYNKK